MEIERNDVVKGAFGAGIVTDVAYGFITDAATDEQVGPVDSLVRILQYDKNDKPVYSYIDRSEIKEIA